MRDKKYFSGPTPGTLYDPLIHGEVISALDRLEKQINEYKDSKMAKRRSSCKAQKRELIKLQAEAVENVFTEYFPDLLLSESFKVSVKRFIQVLGVDSVVEAMEIACEKLELEVDEVLKYFCGICWFRIREKESYA